MSDATSGDCEWETDCYTCLKLEDFLGRGVCKFCIANSTCTAAGGADDDPFYCMDEWETESDQCTQLTAAQQWTIIGICVGIALLVACVYIYYQRQLEKEKIKDEEIAKKQRARDKARKERAEQEYKDIKARAAAALAQEQAQEQEEEEHYDRGECSGEHEIYGEGGCQNEACEELEWCDPMCPGCPDMKPLRPKPKRTYDPAPVQTNNIGHVGPPVSPEAVEFTEINIQEHVPAHEDAPLPQPERPAPFNRAMTAKVLDTNDGDTTSEDDSD